MDKKSVKPTWLTKRNVANSNIFETEQLIEAFSIDTVCVGARCPNMHECFSKKTATFMILGPNCTRQCRFCAVSKGVPVRPNQEEPFNVARAVYSLGLKHAVVTSVTRDDLHDGGAEYFALTTLEIRRINPNVTVELLIPDFAGNWEALKVIVDAKPDIIDHNLETVKSLYSNVRPIANYEQSLALLSKVKEFDANIYTKSGIMVGLGETETEVYELMDDLRRVDCDIITIGQYLRPSSHHIEMAEYIHPAQFKQYERTAISKGFRYVACGAFVRSSYNATDGMNELRNII